MNFSYKLLRFEWQYLIDIKNQLNTSKLFVISKATSCRGSVKNLNWKDPNYLAKGNEKFKHCTNIEFHMILSQKMIGLRVFSQNWLVPNNSLNPWWHSPLIFFLHLIHCCPKGSRCRLQRSISFLFFCPFDMSSRLGNFREKKNK